MKKKIIMGAIALMGVFGGLQGATILNNSIDASTKYVRQDLPAHGGIEDNKLIIYCNGGPAFCRIEEKK